jgi:hypothetical protein
VHSPARRFDTDSKLGRSNYVQWFLWMHYADMERRLGRGSNLAWYGGIGTQRYPMGHSGDVIESWGSLRFQPRFTSTAANVNFGYWSHDLGGHRPATTGAVSMDEELYTRWLQVGTFFPTLRTHMNHGLTAKTAASGQKPRIENVWRLAEPCVTACFLQIPASRFASRSPLPSASPALPLSRCRIAAELLWRLQVRLGVIRRAPLPRAPRPVPLHLRDARV